MKSWGSIALVLTLLGSAMTWTAAAAQEPGEYEHAPPDIDRASGFRLPMPRREDVPAADREIYDRVIARGGFETRGPGRITLYLPQLNELTIQLSSYLRFNAGLSRRAREVAIMTAARETDQAFEWASHEPMAREAGIEPRLIEVIGRRLPTAGLDEADAVIIELGRAAMGDRKVSPELFARAKAVYGSQGLISVVSLMGSYASLSVLLTTFDMQLRDSQTSTLPALTATRQAVASAGAAAAGAQPRTMPASTGEFPAPGRPVATIASPEFSSGPDRDHIDESGQLVAGLAIRPGMVVADIGAGRGYHSVRLSPVVGPRGHIYAEDITPAFLTELSREVARRGLANVTVVHGSADDPKLPARSLDRAVLVYMYHQVQNPYGLLWRLAAALKPGAKVGVIAIDAPVRSYGTPPALLRCEFAAVGYRPLSTTPIRGGEGAYLAVFGAPPGGKSPAPSAIKPCRNGA